MPWEKSAVTDTSSTVKELNRNVDRNVGRIVWRGGLNHQDAFRGILLISYLHRDYRCDLREQAAHEEKYASSALSCFGPLAPNNVFQKCLRKCYHVKSGENAHSKERLEYSDALQNSNLQVRKLSGGNAQIRVAR